MLSMVKPFMTEVTRQKIIAITGAVDEGGKNDLKMRGIAGEDWRQLTGATMPQSDPSISPGYDHATAWAEVVGNTRRRRHEDVNGGNPTPRMATHSHSRGVIRFPACPRW